MVVPASVALNSALSWAVRASLQARAATLTAALSAAVTACTPACASTQSQNCATSGRARLAVAGVERQPQQAGFTAGGHRDDEEVARRSPALHQLDGAALLGDEHPPVGQQLVLEGLEILDDAIVHQRDFARRMRMRIALGRLAVGRPARVADAGAAVDRLVGERGLELLVDRR